MKITQSSSRLFTFGNLERWGATVGGSALVLYGLAKRSLGGVALALLGSDLVYHALARGDGHLHTVFGLEAPKEPIPAMTIPHEQGFKIQSSITVHRNPAELYRFWRNLENLPRIFDHLEAVEVENELCSHWVARAPAGLKVEWDAEIINDIPNELIGWRSLGGADIPNAGSVHFRKSPRVQGTKVQVVLKYDPPAGPVGDAFAKLFGEAPSQTLRKDLRRFKQVMEAQKPSRTRRTRKRM